MKTTAVPIAILALTVAASAAPVQPASVLARSTESPTAADKVLDGVTSAVHTILLRDVGTKSKRQPAFSVDTDRGDDHGFELERRGILHHLLKGTLNLYREIKDMRSHRRRDSSLDAEPLEQRGFGRHAGNLMGHLGTVSDVASLGQSVWGMIHRRDLDERDVPEPAGINELEQRGFGHHAGNLMGHIGTVSNVASLGQSVWGMIHPRDLDVDDE